MSRGTGAGAGIVGGRGRQLRAGRWARLDKYGRHRHVDGSHAWVTNASSTNNLTDCVTTTNIVGGVTNITTVCTTNIVCFLGGPPLFLNPSNCLSGGTGAYPGQSGPNVDAAWFTNAAAPYKVTLNSDAYIASNMFVNASGTVATVTLDLGSSLLGFNSDANLVRVGNQPNSTTTVYIVSNNESREGSAGWGMSMLSGTLALGNNVNAAGTLWITNGTVNCSAIQVGTGSNSVGTIIVSGATLTWGMTAATARSRSALTTSTTATR